jgi:hypothetical protein
MLKESCWLKQKLTGSLGGRKGGLVDISRLDLADARRRPNRTRPK